MHTTVYVSTCCSSHSCNHNHQHSEPLLHLLLVGDPKGVLLKHSAVVATVASLVAFLEDVADEHIGVGDVTLSYLPLAHIFDR